VRVVRQLAARLESGWLDDPISRAAERAWASIAVARLAKRLAVRSGARVVAVGGATLGGSGKTPLAIACARALAEAGARVALVGHAYRASPGRAREVDPVDPIEAVGDEALVCTSDLGGVARVVVGPTRQAALDLALARSDVAVLDGVHQLAPPQRAWMALLAVDPLVPWGAGACPPRGDLRAPIAALRASSDRVVPVPARSRGVHVRRAGAEVLLPWSALCGVRVGLVTALARPDRVLRTLAAHSVIPAVVRTFSDHARAHLHGAPGVDLWLATRKCAIGLRADVAVIDHRAVLEPSLEAALRGAPLDPPPGGVLGSINT
jgi:tetraacyldisaccharide 4'-kinase